MRLAVALKPGVDAAGLQRDTMQDGSLRFISKVILRESKTDSMDCFVFIYLQIRWWVLLINKLCFHAKSHWDQGVWQNPPECFSARTQGSACANTHNELLKHTAAQRNLDYSTESNAAFIFCSHNITPLFIAAVSCLLLCQCWKPEPLKWSLGCWGTFTVFFVYYKCHYIHNSKNYTLLTWVWVIILCLNPSAHISTLV